MSKLFEAINIGGKEIKNRLVMPPMCMYSADTQGHASDFHPMHYGARALGGVGLIVVEATGVMANGRITNNCLGAYQDSHIEGLSRIAQAIKANGATAAIQLGHSGRKCTADADNILAPSPIAFDDDSKTPKQMDEADINELVEAFGAAAARVDKAGFDMIEIHSAHGYLLSTFLSPLSNKRDDEYGGSYENRVRLLQRVIKACRANFSGAIAVRVSADDYDENGNTPKDMAEMLNLVKEGIDIVDVSAGAITPTRPTTYPGYMLPLAEHINKATGLLVMGGGLLTSPQHMEEIVHNNRAQMVFVGRELLRNPHFPLQAAVELKADIKLPMQYERAY